MSWVCTAHGTVRQLISFVPASIFHLAYCFLVKRFHLYDLHLFRSQFLNLLQIRSIDTALLSKNFQGCIVVYLSRFKPVLCTASKYASHISHQHFRIVLLVVFRDSFVRIPQLFCFVNNFFQVFLMFFQKYNFSTNISPLKIQL